MKTTNWYVNIKNKYTLFYFFQSTGIKRFRRRKSLSSCKRRNLTPITELEDLPVKLAKLMDSTGKCFSSGNIVFYVENKVSFLIKSDNTTIYTRICL